jgi:Activator of Hsp90 ATPase homolog 1-like protein
VSSPLRISFDVACGAEQAFGLWTSRIGTWWPPDHTVSGHPAAVVLEGRVGGRIYEQTAEGVEHEWGQVTVWEPPRRLGYTWYLGRSDAVATEVEIHFIDVSGSTLVQIEHRGWERLGADAAAWQERNRIGWETLLPHFAAATTDERGG